jgi:hypothetical protein
MSGKYPLSLAALKGLTATIARTTLGPIVATIERTLRSLFNDEGSLIPVPVATGADRRRLDRRRSRD